MSETSPAKQSLEHNDRSILIGVVVCFVLSGFAALLYQTAWMRQFSLVFGTSELAVAAVLSAYMGGLALGATIAARYVHRVSRPVLTYGLLEAGIAVSALAVPLLLRVANFAYVSAFGGQPQPVDASGLAQSFFYLATAFVVLSVPTAFMGATLPLLTKYVVQREEQIGSRVGLLYASNTLGAVAGTVVAGFVLLPVLGLNGTVFVGVAVNGIVFLIAAMLARSIAKQEEAVNGGAEPEKVALESLTAPTARRFWLLPLMLVSGANSFVYEVLWTRLLGHILGGSVAAFATMLASFLGGIAIGSAVAARFARNRESAITGMVIAQCGVALASIVIYQLLPDAIPDSIGLKGNAVLAVAILMPATLFIGATFPFAVRIFAIDERDAAPASARVYAWNTVGAIVGATLAAFFLIPALKYEGVVKVAAVTNGVLAVAAAFLFVRDGRWLNARTVAALCVATIILIGYRPEMPERILRSSPVTEQRGGEIRFYEVGRSATVIVLEESGYLNLRTNGLPEASTNLKGAPPYRHNQRLLSTLPVLARPDTESMLIVGFGAGATLEGVPPSVKSIDVVELEPEVILANRTFSGERQIDPLSDPRVTVFINDARSALALTDKRYDAIVSQPSHPWTAGASHLYTREFMSLAKDHLSDDGVYLQWMNTQFVDESLLRSLAATMLAVFEQVRVYQWDPEVLFFLGSRHPLNIESDMATSGRPLSDNTVHYLEAGVASVEDAIIALAMDHDTVVAFAGDAAAITDNRNSMATSSAKAMEDERTLTMDRLADLLLAYDPLLDSDGWLHEEFPEPINFTYVSRRLDRLYLRKRAIALSDLMIQRRESSALLMIGLGQERQGDRNQSQRNLLLAIKVDPNDHQAKYALLRSWLPYIAKGEDVPAVIDEQMLAIQGTGAIAIRAWLHAHRGEWRELAELDSALAEVLPTDLWYLDVVKLRSDWRIKDPAPDSQPRLAREATRLIDNAIAIFQDPDLYSMRLASSYVADDAADIIETARRLIHIFDNEVSRAERGEVTPGGRALLSKMQQVKAVQGVLGDLRDDERIPAYKVRNLETATENVADRLKALAAAGT